MLLDPIIISLCAQVSMMANAPTACHEALNAASAQTQITASINYLESYSKNLVESNVSKDILYPTLAIGALANSVQQRQVTAQFPLKPLIDEVNFNLTQTTFSYTVKWEWKF